MMLPEHLGLLIKRLPGAEGAMEGARHYSDSMFDFDIEKAGVALNVCRVHDECPLSGFSGVRGVSRIR